MRRPRSSRLPDGLRRRCSASVSSEQLYGTYGGFAVAAVAALAVGALAFLSLLD